MEIARAMELFECDPDEGEVKWKCTGRGSRLDRIAGTTRPDGYRVVNADREMMYVHRIVWMFVNGEWPPDEVDHIDGNPSNNRIANLRSATRQQNAWNSDRSHLSTTGHPNVTWNSVRQKWEVKIRTSAGRRTIGRFRDLHVAVSERDCALSVEHGEFAVVDRSTIGGRA